MLLRYFGRLRWIRNYLRRERQLEGIQRAKEKGVYKGGKKKINVEQIKLLKSEGQVQPLLQGKLDVIEIVFIAC